MKELKHYIVEAFKINKNTKLEKYNYFPKTKGELNSIIRERIKNEGNECDLNDIDVSEITDMSSLFTWSRFNGDISRWDVSNVENMMEMFYHSKFKGDISNWSLDRYVNKLHIFDGCPIEKKYKPKGVK